LLSPHIVAPLARGFTVKIERDFTVKINNKKKQQSDFKDAEQK
jgi:hypothetical protein